MKNLFLFLFLLLATSGWACDLCGCANGGAYFGIMPQVGRSFVGVRYRHSSYDSHLNSKLLRTREIFRSTEVWARFYPIRRVQVMAFVPYYFNEQIARSSGLITPMKGLGDVTALANYNLFNTFWDSTSHRVNQSFLVGVGIKAPTGRFRYDQTEQLEANNPNFQLGTGSVDVLLNGMYSVRLGNWGWNTDVTYKINSTNSQNYRFGNRLTANSLLFYSFELPTVTFMPNAGLYTETADRDHRDGALNYETGGYATMANMGLEIYLKRLSVGATTQLPIAQELAGGDIRARPRSTLHLTLMF